MSDANLLGDDSKNTKFLRGIVARAFQMFEFKYSSWRNKTRLRILASER